VAPFRPFPRNQTTSCGNEEWPEMIRPLPVGGGLVAYANSSKHSSMNFSAVSAAAR
jgi:hypothetical protein